MSTECVLTFGTLTKGFVEYVVDRTESNSIGDFQCNQTINDAFKLFSIRQYALVLKENHVIPLR